MNDPVAGSPKIIQIVELDEGFILQIDGRAISCSSINALAERLKVALRPENRQPSTTRAPEQQSPQGAPQGAPSPPTTPTQVLSIYNFGATIAGWERGVILASDALAVVRLHCRDLPDVSPFREMLRRLEIAADQETSGSESTELGRRLMARAETRDDFETEDEDEAMERALADAEAAAEGEGNV